MNVEARRLPIQTTFNFSQDAWWLLSWHQTIIPTTIHLPIHNVNKRINPGWPLSSPHIKFPDFSRCLWYTDNSTDSLGVLKSEQESTQEHIVHSKSSEIIVLDNTHLFVHRIHGNSPQAHIFPDFSRFSRLVAGLIISANKFWTNSSIWTRWTGRFKFWVIATGLLTWVRLVSRSARVQTRT